MPSLSDLGFYPFFSTQFELLADTAGLTPARISLDGGTLYQLTGCQAKLGELTGRLRKELVGRARPSTGDWVLVRDEAERATIHHCFDRRTVLTRRMAGSDAELQVVAANVDVFFVVTSANRDHNLRRLERYLTAVAESGARAVVVLNKIDLVADAAPLLAQMAEVAAASEVVAVSAELGAGIDSLRRFLGPGVTCAMVGSSGVGKSSLANRLLGERAQPTRTIDEHDKGRHTTTNRQLFLLPSGGVLIDTPGMRELGVTDEAGGLDEAFADIQALAPGCRFGDCQHEDEPGCAVRAAIADGSLAAERLDSYALLKREAAALALRVDKAAASRARREWKIRSKAARAWSKQKRGE